MIATVGLLTVLLAAGPGSKAATPNASYPSNPEMKQIYDADQADRIGNVDWAKVGPRDAQRYARTKQLLAEGKLHTGADFVEAAYIFQHSNNPDDFLMAHTLAVIGVRKGGKGASYIAAASLDRYLQKIGQKQIYGTQATSSGGPWTREPYDRTLISDALRKELGVPDQATQDRNLEKMRAEVATPPPPKTAPVSEAPAGSTKCMDGPVDVAVSGATWHVFSCDDNNLLATDDGDPPTLIIISTRGGKTVASVANAKDNTPQLEAAKTYFQAMTPSQVADMLERARAASNHKP
jgi:hypothetical protein